MSRTALITGATSQDGAYLSELLLGKGYRVVLAGRSSTGVPPNLVRLGIAEQVELETLDLLDQASLTALVERIEPTEVYNLASQSSVGRSFAEPVATGEVTGLGVARLIEAIRVAAPDARFYQASSSEMFGASSDRPHVETDPYRPRSPYAAAKVYAHALTVCAREAYDIHASCGILFNHESPLRGDQFVTRKITRGAAAIAAGTQQELRLGNLTAQRDWGYAREYVEAMWLMLQQDQPDDYIIATGLAHSVHDFMVAAFEAAELDWTEHVVIDPTLLRPTDIDIVVGDPSKAREHLGWEPKVGFRELVGMMVTAEFEIAARATADASV